ncbi:hypothetical protein K4L44_05730 [Halosquirtibacter laminarini]|uniref:Uncharacterized protein n=1 Tax=Halosquirtibacter laminarini TaxID=3374600 RepID=A0AC61NNY9_9BACT|nr:hypothetical protein K4L44_05730 [Prolixibacteraceae bacterium]
MFDIVLLLVLVLFNLLVLYWFIKKVRSIFRRMSLKKEVVSYNNANTEKKFKKIYKGKRDFVNLWNQLVDQYSSGEYLISKPSPYTIVGVTYENRMDYIHRMKEGDPVILRRELNNPHDKNAIACYDRWWNHLGYMRRGIGASGALWAERIDEKTMMPMAYFYQLLEEGPNIFVGMVHSEDDIEAIQRRKALKAKKSTVVKKRRKKEVHSDPDSKLKFAVIDFETATGQKDSPCELGVTIIENGKITDSKGWLIKPHYETFGVFQKRVHGIFEEDVVNAPSFDHVWKEALPMLDGAIIVAHNAPFDIGVLLATMDYYRVSVPTFEYLCSLVLFRNIWSGVENYKLETLCRYHQIDYHHHRAKADTEATAAVLLKAIESQEITKISDFIEKSGVALGSILADGTTLPCSAIHKAKKVEELSLPNPDNNIIQQCPITGKVVVVTGSLKTHSRSQIEQIVISHGGVWEKTVTMKTDFLVVGRQDLTVVGKDGLSTKHRKALDYIERKHLPVQIVDEDTFEELVHNEAEL